MKTLGAGLRKVSKSAVLRERSQRSCAGIADLIGSVDGLPADLSARKKRYLRATRYGRKGRPD
jgi:hypothetical protein